MIIVKEKRRFCNNHYTSFREMGLRRKKITVEGLWEKDIANSYKETYINSQKFRREKISDYSTEILSPLKIFLVENVYF